MFLDAITVPNGSDVGGIFTFIGDLFNELGTLAVNFITTVFSNPVFAIMFCLPLAGIGITFARKLLSSTHA